MQTVGQFCRISFVRQSVCVCVCVCVCARARVVFLSLSLSLSLPQAWTLFGRYLLATDSEEERTAWMNIINQTCKGKLCVLP